METLNGQSMSVKGGGTLCTLMVVLLSMLFNSTEVAAFKVSMRGPSMGDISEMAGGSDVSGNACWIVRSPVSSPVLPDAPGAETFMKWRRIQLTTDALLVKVKPPTSCTAR